MAVREKLEFGMRCQQFVQLLEGFVYSLRYNVSKLRVWEAYLGDDHLRILALVEELDGHADHGRSHVHGIHDSLRLDDLFVPARNRVLALSGNLHLLRERSSRPQVCLNLYFRRILAP